MGQVKRTQTALRDYYEIWDYIAKRNISAADEILRKFDESILLLSDNPRAGSPREELGSRLRSFPVGQYLILYRPKRKGIEVVRVVHGMRNLPAIFKRRR